MRIILEDAQLYRPKNYNGLKFGTSVIAITANVTIPDDHPVVAGFDPASTGRNITLPTVVDGLAHIIANYSTGTGVLTIKNPSAATIGSVGPGDAALCLCLAGAWACFTLDSNISTGYEGFFGATPIVQPSGAAQNAFTDNSGGTASDTILATAAQSLKSVRLTAASLANAQEYQFDAGFNGSLMSIDARTIEAVTTGAKAATVTGRVNAGALGGGGVISLSGTSAIGIKTAGTSITGAKAFTSAQTFGFTVGSVTTFIEGAFDIEMQLRNDDLNAALAKIAAFGNGQRTALVNLGLIKGSA